MATRRVAKPLCPLCELSTLATVTVPPALVDTVAQGVPWEDAVDEMTRWSLDGIFVGYLGWPENVTEATVQTIFSDDPSCICAAPCSDGRFVVSLHRIPDAAKVQPRLRGRPQ